MQVTNPRRKGGVVAALAAASLGVCLLQPQLVVHQRLLPQKQGENARFLTGQFYFPLIVVALGWRHGRETQQILAASLSETGATGGAAAAPLFDEGDCTYPSDKVNFEKVISKDTLRLLLERSPSMSYRGVNTPTEVAALMHKDISCAIQVHNLFHDFCNTNEKSTDQENAFVNLVECMAFLAHAAVRTRSWTTFSDASQGRECTLSEKYPCGPPSASYHGRGPFQLRGNQEYGAFGEAILQDAERLLKEPELIDPQGISGWAAALWKWMSEQPYGLNCPETMVRSGSGSCHAAIVHQDSPAEAAADALRDNNEAALRDAVAGFGLTIHINGASGMDCCPAALETFRRGRESQQPQQQSAAAAGASVASAFSPATSLGTTSAAPTPVADDGADRKQSVAGEPNQNLPPRQEQLFRAVMSGADTSLHPLASPAPVAAGVLPAVYSSERMPASGVTPLAVSSSAAQLLLPSSPASAVVLAPDSYGAAVVGAASPPLAPPLTAALLVSTFLSFLGVGLPNVPSSTDANAAEVLHPFSSARVPWQVPLPGAADGLCETQGVLTLRAAAENADDTEQARAAVMESLFCLSLVRGCPSLLSKSAAEVSSKSTDEEAATAVQQAAAQHPDSNSVVFKCFETSPAGFATAAAEVAAGTRTQLLSDDVEKAKEKLNASSKATPAGEFSYISRRGVTCAFFSTKPAGF